MSSGEIKKEFEELVSRLPSDLSSKSSAKWKAFRNWFADLSEVDTEQVTVRYAGKDSSKIENVYRRLQEAKRTVVVGCIFLEPPPTSEGEISSLIDRGAKYCIQGLEELHLESVVLVVLDKEGGRRSGRVVHITMRKGSEIGAKLKSAFPEAKIDEVELSDGVRPAAIGTVKHTREHGRSMEPISLDEISAQTGIDIETLTTWTDAIARKRQAILYGPPGTGKTFLADLLARYFCSGGNGVIQMTQLHPSYSYEDFIEGIRPETEDGVILYAWQDGVFKEFCEDCRELDTSVFIIDEINRADLARVLGECLYLLEYRGEELTLPSGKQFSIPDNVLVLGTMNTADRSIALVDYAIRRRFAFIKLKPDYELMRTYLARQGYDADRLIKVLEEINREINDENLSLGPSYFLVDDLKGRIGEIWKTEIEPYLEECFFDRLDRIERFNWTKLRSKLLP
ncbi:MAG: AAA family ATPase [Candidatus Melainabacteria bacterium]|nr:AAA family ATPase [Candidatus Melainabacteria bacterium]